MSNDIEKILEHLVLIEKLLANLLVSDYDTIKDRIIHLSKLGFGPSAVADMLSTTQNYVNVTLSNARAAGEM